ncbi:MAG: hypothetical protein IIB95_06100 [Candidatus Marinimicrobia bacterium]|nr:hypothetical protein [Candidatus Neomarinimicrobiota bacterium]MCH7763299.1 hypothetical protein [Candidatus Neomarinimicrobiota bacterium]
MRIVLIIIILWSILHAGEVDQYLAWNQLPNDESHLLNKLFNEEIQKALDEINKHHNDCSCTEAAGRILKHFGIGLSTPLEMRLKKMTELDKYPTDDIQLSERYKRSIFRREYTHKIIDKYQDYSLNLQIDEVINVGGIYIGLDKLTHFTASGYIYYKIYNLGLEHTGSEEAAIQMAINIGVFGEKNILGKIASGVFSYADLESNYQGFQFAMDLCRDGTIYLKRTGKGWELEGSFDLRNYVNPFWDESYNPSYYYEGYNLTLMPKSEAVLSNIPNYCMKYRSKRIQSIFTYYGSIADSSYSIKYLQKLINKGELPDPSSFNIRTICRE